jgi:hypothetical protein
MENQDTSLKRIIAGGLFALFVALFVEALTEFGVISTALGHIFMIAAFIVGALIICSEAKPLKYRVIFCVGLFVIMATGDYAIVRLKKPEAESLVSTAPVPEPHVTLSDFSVDSADLRRLTVHSEVENIGTDTALGLTANGTCVAAPLSRDSEDRIFEILEEKATNAKGISVKSRDLEPGPQQRFWEQIPCPMPNKDAKKAIHEHSAVWYFVLFDTYGDSLGVKRRVERCLYIAASSPRIDNMLFHICGSHNQTVKVP